jgi:hypothetical protein
MAPVLIDSSIRQAITFCWLSIPREQRSIDQVESEIRRLVERALSALREDARAFGIEEERIAPEIRPKS